MSMKNKGCSIIFFNDHDQVLLFLRDNISSIPYPNMWDLLGGHVEKNETPEQCIIREIKEEIDIELKNFQQYKIVDFDDRQEYVFLKKVNLDINKLELTEGQQLKWFTRDEIKQLHLACGFDKVVRNFFKDKIK